MKTMTQKFPKLTFIKVTSEMPQEMSHFEAGFEGIVEGTYSQMYGGRDVDNYSVWMIRNGKVVNRISWYRENQLTALPEQSRERAEQMIEDYNFRR